MKYLVKLKKDMKINTENKIKSRKGSEIIYQNSLNNNNNKESNNLKLIMVNARS